MIRFILKIFFVVVLVFCIVQCIRYHIEKKNFHSFNLEELKKQELVIQTIEFKKFFVHGTEMKGESSKYTDELQVYHVSGHADISFTDIDHIKINEVDSDINDKILRLNYQNDKRTSPFTVNIIINENDVNKVQSFESMPLTGEVFGFALSKDLIKPEYSQAQIVEKIKEELKKEFERQITDSVKARNLDESDLYQTFLKRLTEIIKRVSDWESVEVKFTN